MLSDRSDGTQGRVVYDALVRELPGTDLRPNPALVQDLGAAHSVNASYWKFWPRLSKVLPTWNRVEAMFRADGLPEVYAAIPYAQFAYHTRASHPRSPRAGLWEMLPGQGGLQMLQCQIRGVDHLVFNPTQEDLWNPRSNAYETPVCAVDERMDVDRATAVAIADMKVTWDEERAHPREAAAGHPAAANTAAARRRAGPARAQALLRADPGPLCRPGSAGSGRAPSHLRRRPGA